MIRRRSSTLATTLIVIFGVPVLAIIISYISMNYEQVTYNHRKHATQFMAMLRVIFSGWSTTLDHYNDTY